MLVFDFDGVLIYSIDEIALSAYNAATGSAFRSLDRLPADYLRRFRSNRRRARNAGQIMLLAEACLEAQTEEIDDAEFQAEAEHRRLELPELGQRLFQIRTQFMQEDQPAWLTLNRPYQPLWDELHAHTALPLAILTGKNRAAVQMLCRHYGLAVPSNAIYSGEDGEGKPHHLRAIIARHPGERYHVVDDIVRNLAELEREFRGSPAIHFYLATWDLNDTAAEEEARHLGFTSLSLAGAVELVRRESRSGAPLS